MKNLLRLLCVFILFVVTGHLSAGELWGGSFTKLESRIVRSVAVASFNQSMIIVGNKGSAAGDAQVFASSDGGVSWRFLNEGKSLAPAATDVQAVAWVSQSIALAGTWKYGLYRSDNAGRSFTRVNSLPATDIRSILVLRSGRILVATGARGIWRSDDSGTSWQSTSQSTGYYWSVKVSMDSVLFATSPTTGVVRSTDDGDTWNLIYATEGLYEAISLGNRIVAVGENGLSVSLDGGRSWHTEERFNGKRLSSVSSDGSDVETLYIGSWTDGLWEYSVIDAGVTQYATGLPVLHVRETDQAILLGSWGRGLTILPRSSHTEYLVSAARVADFSVVNQLLSDGANPDAFDNNRNSALTYAGRDGLTEMAAKLLEAGADVNWVDGEGVTPLILAAFNNHPDLVRLLLQNSADKHIVDGFGKTALDYGLARGDADPVVKLLK